MARKPVKKPVRKKRLPRPKEEILSGKLIEKLTRDGYCFDPVHEETIRKIKERTVAAEMELGEIKAKHAEEMKAAAKALEDEVRDRADRIFELEESKEKLLQEVTVARELLAKREEELKIAKDLAAKEFKEANRCFDIMHKAYMGMKYQRMSSVDLITLGCKLAVRTTFTEPVVVLYSEPVAHLIGEALRDSDDLVNELIEKMKARKAKGAKETPAK